MLYLFAFLTALVSYLIGSISGAIIISKKVSGSDIRESGSKNAGTTNMLRVHGKKLAILTLLVDVLKGVIAVLIGILIDFVLERQYGMKSFVSQSEWLVGNMKYIAAVFAILGHDFPIYFGFKGGKGVATSIGVALASRLTSGLFFAISSGLPRRTTRANFSFTA